jgi:serine/threonine-protein kinase RsbW
MPTETAQLDGIADASLPDRVYDALEALWEKSPQVGDEDRTLFTLAVSEVAANIVEHAQSREPIRVRVALEVTGDAATAVFTDTADPALIDLGDVSMPDADAESGRGLALALATLDELVHETDNGNTWRLRRNLRPV